MARRQFQNEKKWRGAMWQKFEFLPYSDEIGDLTNFGFAKQGRIRNKVLIFYMMRDP